MLSFVIGWPAEEKVLLGRVVHHGALRLEPLKCQLEVAVREAARGFARGLEQPTVLSAHRLAGRGVAYVGLPHVRVHVRPVPAAEGEVD